MKKFLITITILILISLIGCSAKPPPTPPKPKPTPIQLETFYYMKKLEAVIETETKKENPNIWIILMLNYEIEKFTKITNNGKKKTYSEEEKIELRKLFENIDSITNN